MSRYDDDLWERVPDHDHPPPAHITEFVRGLGHAERALDIGCGDGRLTAELRAGDVVAADVSAVALRRAEARLGGEAARQIEFVRVEPDEPLPFDDNGFDLVLCAETLEHVRDVQLLLSEARRVLRPRGRLAVTTPASAPLRRPEHPFSPHIRFFTKRSLLGALDATGFEVESLTKRSATLLAVARR